MNYKLWVVVSVKKLMLSSNKTIKTYKRKSKSQFKKNLCQVFLKTTLLICFPKFLQKTESSCIRELQITSLIMILE